MRSSWKLIHELNNEHKIFKKAILKGHVRSFTITPALLKNERRISVYNGKRLFKIKINKKMLGFKLGQLCFSKKKVNHKKFKFKKKK